MRIKRRTKLRIFSLVMMTIGIIMIVLSAKDSIPILVGSAGLVLFAIVCFVELVRERKPRIKSQDKDK